MDRVGDKLKKLEMALKEGGDRHKSVAQNFTPARSHTYDDAPFVKVISYNHYERFERYFKDIVTASHELQSLKSTTLKPKYLEKSDVIDELCREFSIDNLDIGSLPQSSYKPAERFLELILTRIKLEIVDLLRVNANRQTVEVAQNTKDESIKSGARVRVANDEEARTVWKLQLKHRYTSTLWRIFSQSKAVLAAFIVGAVAMILFTWLADQVWSGASLYVISVGPALWSICAIWYIDRKNKEIKNMNPYRWSKCDHRLNQIRGAKFISDIKASLDNYLSVSLFIRDELDRALRYRPRNFSFWIFFASLFLFMAVLVVWVGAGVMGMKFQEASAMVIMIAFLLLFTSILAYSDHLKKLRERELLMWLEWLIADEQREPIS